MNTKTLFKTDDVEVQQSSKGAISFGYSDATAAMFDLYGRITELEEQLNECSGYLEGTESPADCIERKHYNEHRLMKRYAELAMKCDQLEAQNERLKSKGMELSGLAEDGGLYHRCEVAEDFDAICEETPAVSLAHVECRGVEKFMKLFAATNDSNEVLSGEVVVDMLSDFIKREKQRVQEVE